MNKDQQTVLDYLINGNGKVHDVHIFYKITHIVANINNEGNMKQITDAFKRITPEQEIEVLGEYVRLFNKNKENIRK